MPETACANNAGDVHEVSARMKTNMNPIFEPCGEFVRTGFVKIAIDEEGVNFVGEFMVATQWRMPIKGTIHKGINKDL